METNESEAVNEIDAVNECEAVNGRRRKETKTKISRALDRLQRTRSGENEISSKSANQALTGFTDDEEKQGPMSSSTLSCS